MGKKSKQRPRRGQADLHVLESLVWGVCRRKHSDPDEANEEFLATVKWDRPDERDTAGGIPSRGYG